MAQPIQEPTDGRAIQGLAYRSRQLFRRPGPAQPRTLAYFDLKLENITPGSRVEVPTSGGGPVDWLDLDMRFYEGWDYITDAQPVALDGNVSNLEGSDIGFTEGVDPGDPSSSDIAALWWVSLQTTWTFQGTEDGEATFVPQFAMRLYQPLSNGDPNIGAAKQVLPQNGGLGDYTALLDIGITLEHSSYLPTYIELPARLDFDGGGGTSPLRVQVAHSILTGGGSTEAGVNAARLRGFRVFRGSLAT